MTIVNSVSEYVTKTSSRNKDGDVRWFRGIKSTEYTLISTLYRKTAIDGTPLGIEKILDIEEWLLERFRERSGPFRAGPQPADSIELLFEMQHYGAPTRLLDWSENALVSLWFAVTGKSDNDSAVWILDPSKWNDLAFSQNNHVKNVLSPLSQEVNAMQPWNSARNDRLSNAPICIYGTHNNRRIVSQRGTFTLSGRSTEPMEEFIKTLVHDNPQLEEEILSKITIPHSSRNKIKQELYHLGFTHSMIFPDLVGLASELDDRLNESGLL
ncbi:FRG domain-containing protein [Rhodococcus sp. IEGM 1318]|uniref:FRG domain-containing protein n=1 Tax=Rhodococcus sp. IEGM 1318 TaxID=3082226 RepID=UPI0029543658|nr:FRG domain-containing protein [Rhodococcus sp. IEGM 1318]MDV8008962.1 FRG domain-containing protein [Rhodococcus sp. IEGM 1318]